MRSPAALLLLLLGVVVLIHSADAVSARCVRCGGATQPAVLLQHAVGVETRGCTEDPSGPFKLALGAKMRRVG
jgi:hypothetical protein